MVKDLSTACSPATCLSQPSSMRIAIAVGMSFTSGVKRFFGEMKAVASSTKADP